jgi:hypothetical protein
MNTRPTSRSASLSVTAHTAAELHGSHLRPPLPRGKAGFICTIIGIAEERAATERNQGIPIGMFTPTT